MSAADLAQQIVVEQERRYQAERDHDLLLLHHYELQGDYDAMTDAFASLQRFVVMRHGGGELAEWLAQPPTL